MAEKAPKNRPETPVKEAEQPAVTVSPEGAERPETIVEEAEQPAKVAAAAKPDDTPKAVKILDLGDVQVPVIVVTNPHYGLSGPTVTITVAVKNEDGTREGLQLNDVPERLLK